MSVVSDCCLALTSSSVSHRRQPPSLVQSRLPAFKSVRALISSAKLVSATKQKLKPSKGSKRGRNTLAAGVSVATAWNLQHSVAL